jgi:quinol-cytochrome oxidoreductase complex cytochrome b subunit
MNKIIVKNNINLFSISLFLILFIIFQYFKPGFLYNNDGSLRQFGLGRKKETIVPVWLFSIILAILSYIIILYYVSNSRFF